MIHSRPSKLRVLLVTLILSAVMVLAQARPAQAFGDPITMFLALAYGGVLTIASIVCIPIAAARDKSFGREYKGCFVPFWTFERYEDDEDLPEPTSTLVDEQIHPNEESKEIASVETVEVQPSDDKTGKRLTYKLNVKGLSVETGAAGTGTATTSQTPEAAIAPKVEQGSGQPSQRLETAYAITPPDYKVDWSLVKEPVYKDGDWWKVKTEVKPRRPGWRCHFDYSDYLLEIQEGKPKLYGIYGTKKEGFDCPEIGDGILGKITRKLKFPLRVGNSWTHRFLYEHITGRESWVTVDYKVLGRQKVQTPKGMFEVFKLSSYTTMQTPNTYLEHKATYYYSPKVKAIILRKHITLHSGSLRRERTYTVVDFNVSH